MHETRWRFHLRSMFAWTTLVAVLFSLWRSEFTGMVAMGWLIWFAFAVVARP